MWAVASLGSVTAKERGCLTAALSTMGNVQESLWRGSLQTSSNHEMHVNDAELSAGHRCVQMCDGDSSCRPMGRQKLLVLSGS